MKLTVIGGGGTGAALSADLTIAGHDVALFELENQPGCLPDIQKAGVIYREGKDLQDAVPAPKITFDPRQAVEDAEVIFVAAAAYRHQALCQAIIPYLAPGQAVCFFSGNCGSLVLREQGAPAGILAGETVGSYATTRYRGNARVFYANPPVTPKAVAAFPAKDNQAFAALVNRCYPCVCAPETPVRNVLEAALNSPNIVCHLLGSLLCTSAMELQTDFHFYRDGISPSVQKVLEGVERERRAILKQLDYVADLYDPIGVIRGCRTYSVTGDPKYEGFILSDGPNGPRHRYIAEDAFAGGPLLSSLGRTLGVPTPLMDAGVALASEINGVDYQRQGITLERFGLDGRTPQELNWYFEHGVLPTN